MVKPDGVRKGLVGEIIRRLEQRDLKIIGLKMFRPTRSQIDEHYPKDDAWIARVGEKTLATYHKYGYDAVEEVGTDEPLEIGRIVRNWIVEYMCSAPLVPMVVQGVHAIDMVRKIVGHTIPAGSPSDSIRRARSRASSISRSLMSSAKSAASARITTLSGRISATPP